MTHVTFIHGIGNKPAADEPHNIWLRSLAAGLDGINLGAEGTSGDMLRNGIGRKAAVIWG